MRTSVRSEQILAQFDLACPLRCHCGMGSHGVQRFTDLRAWQTCVVYKRAVYRLCEKEPIASDWKRRGQLEESVWGPPGHIAEGFGRFAPLDFARFVVMARASLIESQNHLLDFVDRGYINEKQRSALNGLAETALEEVTGLLKYLQSPEALRNARRARERRLSRTQNREPGTPNPGTPNPRTLNPRTPNRTPNEEP